MVESNIREHQVYGSHSKASEKSQGSPTSIMGFYPFSTVSPNLLILMLDINNI
jgi:hypothetical protein